MCIRRITEKEKAEYDNWFENYFNTPIGKNIYTLKIIIEMYRFILADNFYDKYLDA